MTNKLYKKLRFLDQHRFLSLLMFILMLSTIPLILLALNYQQTTYIRAYYPSQCTVPKIPRGKICVTGWKLTRDENGCRVFNCEDAVIAQTGR